MGVRDDSASETEGRGYAAAVLLVVIVLVALVALPFLPLGLALIEQVLYGTNHVENFCREIGIHDELGALYRTVFWFLK